MTRDDKFALYYAILSVFMVLMIFGMIWLIGFNIKTLLSSGLGAAAGTVPGLMVWILALALLNK